MKGRDTSLLKKNEGIVILEKAVCILLASEFSYEKQGYIVVKKMNEL